MKTGEMRNRLNAQLDARLHERLLLGRRVERDRLVLADGVLRAALDGSRPLTGAERAALQASPLTLRRLRTLALEARAACRGNAANEEWEGSAGMLRAADSGAALTQLDTDDGCWRLHFVATQAGWRVILQLLPQAPWAARLLSAGDTLRVLDGAGSEVLRGRLDADGELEAVWPFAQAPREHFQGHGARFSVQSGG